MDLFHGCLPCLLICGPIPWWSSLSFNDYSIQHSFRKWHLRDAMAFCLRMQRIISGLNSIDYFKKVEMDVRESRVMQYVLLLLFRIHFHFYVGCMVPVRRLYLTRSCDSSADKALSLTSRSRCHQTTLALVFLSITITVFPTYYYPRLNTRPYDFKLLSCIFFQISSSYYIMVW